MYKNLKLSALSIGIVAASISFYSCEKEVVQFDDNKETIDDVLVQKTNESDGFSFNIEDNAAYIQEGLLGLLENLQDGDYIRVSASEGTGNAFATIQSSGNGPTFPAYVPEKYLGAYGSNLAHALKEFGDNFGDGGCEYDICIAINSNGSYDVWDGC